MGIVTIGANPYTVYGDLPAAQLYFAAGYSPAAVAWRALVGVADAQAQTLVEAKRMIDRQVWAGTKTGGAGQLDEFPRDGVLDKDGASALSSADTLLRVTNAEYELAAAIALDPSVAASSSTGSNIQSMAAGSASLSFFAPTDGSRFVTIVQELLGYMMGGAGAGVTSGIVGTGATCDDSDRFDFTLTE